MTSPEDDAGLLGRKRVRVRLRPNLLIVPQREGAATRYVVKDPVSLAFFRLDERQHAVVALMDGSRTLDEVREAFEQAHRPERLPAEELEAFAAQLLANGLAISDAPLAGATLYEKGEQLRQRSLRSVVLSALSIRIPLFDPDRLLGRLAPVLGRLFSPGGALLVAAATLSAAALVLTHWGDVLARLPHFRELLTFRALATFWVAFGAVKILHEFGHGLCCRRLGGEVHEMGVLVLLGFPAAYCDVSDAWKLPNKWRRIAVAAAGVYVELLVASIAVFVWWFTDRASLAHQVSFGLILVCGAQTLLFNANPLARFDGYYALSDWLDVPNLADVSWQALRARLLGWLGLPAAPALPLSRGRKNFVVLYAMAAAAYRWCVLVVAFVLLHDALAPYKLGSLVVVLALAVAAAVLAGPLGRAARALTEHGRFREMKPIRLCLVLAGVVLALVVVFAVPFPRTVEGAAVFQVEPEQAERVAAPDCGGFLAEVYARDGQTVREGDVLAVLVNPKLEVAVRINEADLELRRQQRQDLAAQLAESAADDRAAAELRQTDFEIEALAREAASLREQKKRLVLRAPRAGLVLSAPARERAGEWLEKGAEVFRVGNDRALRAVVLLDPEARRQVRGGAGATVRVRGGARSWPAVVSAVAEVEAQQVPPALAKGLGGDVPTTTDPATKQERPHEQHYLVALRLGAADRSVHPGVVGRARIDVGSETLWERVRRSMSGAFR
jgi:putative peptide zinc metalloprotease protein